MAAAKTKKSTDKKPIEKRPTEKKSKVQKLKPIDKTSSVARENNIKLALVGAGILLFVLMPFLGFLLILAVGIKHFKKKS